jgi:hypothetical protein
VVGLSLTDARRIAANIAKLRDPFQKALITSMRDLLLLVLSLAAAAILAAAGIVYPSQLSAWQAVLWSAVAIFVIAAIGLAVHYFIRTKPKTLRLAERDVGVGEAIAFMCLGKWGSRFSDAAGAPGVDTVSKYNTLLQAAADGAIPVWGKRQNYGVHEPIPKDFWFNNDFEWFSMLRWDAHSQSKTSTFQGDRYLSLMTSRVAALEA